MFYRKHFKPSSLSDATMDWWNRQQQAATSSPALPSNPTAPTVYSPIYPTSPTYINPTYTSYSTTPSYSVTPSYVSTSSSPSSSIFSVATTPLTKIGSGTLSLGRSINSAVTNVTNPIGKSLTNTFGSGYYGPGQMVLTGYTGLIGAQAGGAIGSSLALPGAVATASTLGVGAGTSIGAAVATGATIGSALPVIGTIIGAGVGLLVGGLGKLFQGDAKARHAKQIGAVNATIAGHVANWRANVQSGIWQIPQIYPDWAYDPADYNTIYWMGTGPVDYRGFSQPPDGWVPYTNSGTEMLGMCRWRGAGISPIQAEVQKAAAALATANSAATAAAQRKAKFQAQQAAFNAKNQQILSQQQADELQQAQADAAAQQANQDAQSKADAQSAFDSALTAARSALNSGNFAAADAAVSEAQAYTKTLGFFSNSQIRDMQFRIQDARNAAATSAEATTTTTLAPPVTNATTLALQTQLQNLQAQTSSYPTTSFANPTFSTPMSPAGDTSYSSSYSASVPSADDVFASSGMADVSASTTIKLQSPAPFVNLSNVMVGAGVAFLAYQAWKHYKIIK